MGRPDAQLLPWWYGPENGKTSYSKFQNQLLHWKWVGVEKKMEKQLLPFKKNYDNLGFYKVKELDRIL